MDNGTKIFFMKYANDFKKKFGMNFTEKVKLSNYSWFNLGGYAEYFFKPKDVTQLLQILEEATKNGSDYIVLGRELTTSDNISKMIKKVESYII